MDTIEEEDAKEEDANIIEVDDINDFPPRTAYANPSNVYDPAHPRTSTKARIPQEVGAPHTAKQEGYALLRAAGMPPVAAGKAVGLAGNYPYRLDKQLRPIIDKHRLDSARKLRLASSATELLVQGLPVGQCAEVKAADVARVADSIYREHARRNPVEGGQQGSSLTVNLIDLSGFAFRPQEG